MTISKDKILDHDTVDFILRSGYSRIPVHEPNRPLAFVGLLLLKKLSVYDPSQNWPVSAFSLSILPEAEPSINCFQALDYFQTGRAHLLLLSTTPGIDGGAIGVVTLEDIIEEIISEEIVDETDQYEDNQSKRRARRAKNAAVMRGIVEYRTARPGSHSVDQTPLLNTYGRPLSPSRTVVSGGGDEHDTRSIHNSHSIRSALSASVQSTATVAGAIAHQPPAVGSAGAENHLIDVTTNGHANTNTTNSAPGTPGQGQPQYGTFAAALPPATFVVTEVVHEEPEDHERTPQ